MRETELDAVIYRIGRGLALRRRLRVAVDAALVGGILTAVCLLGQALGLLPGGVAAVVGGGAALWLLAFRFPRRDCSAATAGSYLDRRLALKERLCSYVTRSASTSVFATALARDAAESFVAHIGQPLLDSVLPMRTPYLALPTAAIIALLLLGGSQIPPDKPVVLVPVEIPAAADRSAAMTGKLAELVAQRRAVAARLERTGNEEDRRELARVDRLIAEEFARLASAQPGTPTSEADDGSERDGTKAEAVTVVAKVAAPPATTSAATTDEGAEQSAWEQYRALELSIPPQRRGAVRAYLQALANAASQP